MNSYFFCFLISCKIKEKKKLDTKEIYGNNKKRKFQKEITWSMEQSLDTKWIEPHDHVVMQPTRKDTNLSSTSGGGGVLFWSDMIVPARIG